MRTNSVGCRRSLRVRVRVLHMATVQRQSNVSSPPSGSSAQRGAKSS
ncbi:Uncharacterised protein [Mycobacteroides abscessus subsp. abscessus]|nr:Uncharacterised protein [Mycobacteroides abscessus subsp. abscessus]